MRRAVERGLCRQHARLAIARCPYCGGNDEEDMGHPIDHCTDCARPKDPA